MTSPARRGSPDALGELLEHLNAHVVELAADDRGRCLRVPPAAEGARDACRVDVVHTASRDDEHAPVHLHEKDEPLRVREVHDLVREVRNPLDVPGHRRAASRISSPPASTGSSASSRCWRRSRSSSWSGDVEVRGDEVLPRAVPHAPGEGVHVALGRRRVRERARVLVDPERERRRLEWRRRDLALREDPDERRRQRAVRREHGGLRVHPVRELRHRRGGRTAPSRRRGPAQRARARRDGKPSSSRRRPACGSRRARGASVSTTGPSSSACRR